MNKIVPILLILLLVGTACRKQVAPVILAEVNGEVLELEAFKATLAEGEWDALDSAARRHYVEDWVNLTLLAQAAEKANLDDDLGLQARMSFALKKVKANALIAERLAQMRISEDQMFSYFRMHQSEFSKPALTYNIQRIAFPDKLSAEKLLQQLNQGLDFSVALRRYNSENLHETSGMMGYVDSASADSVFWLAAQEMELNIAGIVTKDAIWYVFRYTDSKESEEEASFEQHRVEIRRKIISQKQEEVFQSLLREIKAQNNEIYYY